MWKHWESSHAQQTCTNAVIAHQHGMWEGDLLHYCIDYDCDINLESTCHPKVQLAFMPWLLQRLTNEAGSGAVRSNGFGQIRDECHDNSNPKQTRWKESRSQEPCRESWSARNTGVLGEAKARDHVTPREREAQREHDNCPCPVHWTSRIAFHEFFFIFYFSNKSFYLNQLADRV